MFHSNQSCTNYRRVSSGKQPHGGNRVPIYRWQGDFPYIRYIRMPKTSPRSVGSRSGCFFFYCPMVFLWNMSVLWRFFACPGSSSDFVDPDPWIPTAMWPTPGCIEKKPSEIPWRYVINMGQSICTTWTNQHKWLVGGWKNPLSLITQNRSNRSNLRAACMRKHHLDRSICPICLSVRPWMTRT